MARKRYLDELDSRYGFRSFSVPTSDVVRDRARTLAEIDEARRWEESLKGRMPAPTPVQKQVRKSSTKKRQGVVKPKKSIDVSKGGEYVVKAGDTLSSILKNTTGSYKNYREIAKANGISDPNKIYAGMKIKIPGYNPSVSPASSVEKTDTTNVTLQQGISSKQEGTQTEVTDTGYNVKNNFRQASNYVKSKIDAANDYNQQRYNQQQKEQRKEYYRNILTQYPKLQGETNQDWIARAQSLDKMARKNGAVKAVYPEFYVLSGGKGGMRTLSYARGATEFDRQLRKNIRDTKRGVDEAYPNPVNTKNEPLSSPTEYPFQPRMDKDYINKYGTRETVNPTSTKPSVVEYTHPYLTNEVQTPVRSMLSRMRGRVEGSIARIRGYKEAPPTTPGTQSKTVIRNTKGVKPKVKVSRKEKLRGNKSRTNARNAHRTKRNNKNSGNTITL